MLRELNRLARLKGLPIRALQSQGFEIVKRRPHWWKRCIVTSAKFPSHGGEVFFGDVNGRQLQYPTNAFSPAPLTFVHGIGARGRHEQHAHLWPALRTGDRNQVDAKCGLD
jgi:hypothetical protein